MTREVIKLKSDNTPLMGADSPPRPSARFAANPPRERMGMNAKVDRLLELMGEDSDSLLQTDVDKKAAGKVKPFKLPRRVQRQVQKGVKKGKALILYVRENKAIIPVTTIIKDGRYYVDGTWHNADPESLYMWVGKIPCFLQPAWSINPVRTWKDGEVDAGNSADAERVVLDILERSDTLQKKKGFTGMTWVFIVIGLIVVGYLIFGGGA